MTEFLILGGGVAGLSLASFLNDSATVLEREETVGGLSRSYSLNGIAFDIGPHIIFSKNKEILDLHTTMIPTNKVRRSNQIVFRGRFVKYPFENDLAALEPADRDYCLQEFLSNPYEHYQPKNMLQFFLATFGEGITRLYLQPYNEKIWKFDPSCMDTQMVERIPKPPREDVIKSAQGIATEGYTHQLYFNYPSSGGFQTLVNAYRDRAERKGQTVATGVQVQALKKTDRGWEATTNIGTFAARRLVNCMPLHELFRYLPAPPAICRTLDRLLYNSIYIVVVQVKKDRIGDHFALYIPDKDIIFHRVSKLNFLGDEYGKSSDTTTLLVEVTFRPGSYLSGKSHDAIVDEVVRDLCRVGFIDKEDVIDATLRMEKYAYVIYDLEHRRNVDSILDYLLERGIRCSGRFAEFEYLNTDGVAERTLKLARELNSERAPHEAAVHAV
jgi:protoporphyrinogen oxidase